MKENLSSKIKHLEELSLKDDLNDIEYKELLDLKNKLKEKENQKNLPKQVIVIRKDLNMNSGKLAAQVAHASFGVFSKNFEILKKDENNDVIEINFNNNNHFDNAKKTWLLGKFTKIILYVKSEKALLDLYKKVCEKGIPNCLIEDSGFTCFEKPTITCLGIGPCYQEDLKGITDKLQIYKD